MLKKLTRAALFVATAALMLLAGTFTSCSNGNNDDSGRKTVAQFKTEPEDMRMTFYDDNSFEIEKTQEAEKAARAAKFTVIITGHYEGSLSGRVAIKDAIDSDGEPVEIEVTISGEILTLEIDGVDYTLTKNGSTGTSGGGNGDDGEDGGDDDDDLIIPEGGNGDDGSTTKVGYLTIMNGVVTSCDKDANGKIEIPDGVTGIQGGSLSSAFWERTGITEVVIPDSVTTIGRNAFYKCTSLKKVTIGKNVKSIGNSAFTDCTALESIEIPDSVTTIGKEAFWQCYALKSVVIGDGVTTIGESAFWNSRNLKSLTLGKSVETISDHAFQDCAMTSVELPSSVRTIGNWAFYETALESVTLPEGIESIGSNAFISLYSKFASIKIPASVKFIGNGAFSIDYDDAKVEFIVIEGWYYNPDYEYGEKDSEEDWLPVADYDGQDLSEAEKLVYLFKNSYALKRK